MSKLALWQHIQKLLHCTALDYPGPHVSGGLADPDQQGRCGRGGDGEGGNVLSRGASHKDYLDEPWPNIFDIKASVSGSKA